ncbi:hypothetical protein [Streptomyces sp. NPDC058304]|uniref:hypothetical protein n=1 Tax=Streptomyces sp. NPDC058304 TaxID=3346437 RepID=UPI0036F05A3D
MERLRSEVPGARTELRMLDLADLESVRGFAEGWIHDRLDLLVNNAGVAMVPFSRTADGFESSTDTERCSPTCSPSGPTSTSPRNCSEGPMPPG